ncbi:uncharacterized protein HD556DRAFT_1523604 [Suillus plorans]|uniref:CHAT domain-containing protein n=1 Tax=Suillus plorans TaxID=116603 RepID=A0A9P7DUW8_9AGAM|nr:uncharacterized protein HD556DRAFT_1523604 [Suillus plorans]KAG1803600.1 hypothetical protein HD556DRAFT_1523604 [Suillus plorans]
MTKPHEQVHSKPCSRIPGCTLLAMASRTLRSLIIHEHLTLLDIVEKHLPHAEFAFLLACHTAVGDEETPDEVVRLAAGIQFSGFKNVVGTLWEVDDAVAKHVVEASTSPMLMSTQSLLLILAVCSTNLAYPISGIDVEGAVTSHEAILIDVGLVCRNMDGKDVGQVHGC